MASKFFNSWLLALCLLINNPLTAKISQCDTLTPIIAATADFSEKSLVVFDVDRVLIDSRDAILRLANRNLLLQLKMKYAGTLPPKIVADLTSLVYLQGNSLLIDPQSVELINSLKKRAVPVIALTATSIGGIGKIASIQDWRLEELEKFGISFESSFSQYPGFELSDLTGLGPSPVFKKGILFSSIYSKGLVLASFLKTVGFQPDKVLFLDDLLYNVTSVENALDDMGVKEVLAYQYLGAEKLPNSIDRQVADLQLKTLVEKEEWLSDIQARKLLETDNP